jgi:hypothetical protein
MGIGSDLDQVEIKVFGELKRLVKPFFTNFFTIRTD